MGSKPRFEIAMPISHQTAEPNEGRPTAGQPGFLPAGARAARQRFQVEIRQKRVDQRRLANIVR
jgi:hypothetical protein